MADEEKKTKADPGFPLDQLPHALAWHATSFLTHGELAALQQTGHRWHRTVTRGTGPGRPPHLAHVPLVLAFVGPTPPTVSARQRATQVETLTLATAHYPARALPPWATGPFAARRLRLVFFDRLPARLRDVFPRLHTLVLEQSVWPAEPLPGVQVFMRVHPDGVRPRCPRPSAEYLPDLRILGHGRNDPIDGYFLAPLLPQLEALSIPLEQDAHPNMLATARRLTRLVVTRQPYWSPLRLCVLPNLRVLSVLAGNARTWTAARHQPQLQCLVVVDQVTWNARFHGQAVSREDQGLAQLTTLALQKAHHLSGTYGDEWVEVWVQCPRLRDIYVTTRTAAQQLTDTYARWHARQQQSPGSPEPRLRLERDLRRRAASLLRHVADLADRRNASAHRRDADWTNAHVMEASVDADHLTRRLPWTVHVVEASHAIFHPIPELDVKWRL